MNERRTKRSGEREEALQFLVEAVADRSELPALFVRNDDGSESLLNFSIEDGDVLIHRVAARFIVRRGRLTGCIVNKGFAGSGDRLKSGTVAPDVTRERKDAHP